MRLKGRNDFQSPIGNSPVDDAKTNHAVHRINKQSGKEDKGSQSRWPVDGAGKNLHLPDHRSCTQSNPEVAVEDEINQLDYE